MAISIVPSTLRVTSLALGLWALSGCDRASFGQTEPQASRYVVVSIVGVTPGTTEVVELDTATGATWRLARSGTPGVQDELGWHPMPNLTIESRTPYYRHRQSPAHSAAEGK